MLAQSVVSEYAGSVRFVTENYGDCELARRFGVTRYPALFVDDILFATPDDFGFYGKEATGGGGRYAPLRTAAAHEHFRRDLTACLDLVLAGRANEARAAARPAAEHPLGRFPELDLDDLDGEAITTADRDGRVILVDFWATWCPPCRATLPWLKTLEHKFGDRLLILTLAVESPLDAVRKVADASALPVRWIVGTPERVRAFGDISAVPTLLLFDRDGDGAARFVGAPPTLHADVEARLEELMK